MADVAGDRGQLLLLGALVLAVLFVSFAALANTAVYTENLATRDSDPGTGVAVEYRTAAVTGIGGLVEYVNRHNDTSYGALRANASAAVEEWDNASAKTYGATGGVVETEYASAANGTRIAQTNSTRRFTNATGAPNWAVASGLGDDGLRAHRLNVSTSNLETASGPDAFRVDYTDSDGDTRSVYVYRNTTPDPDRVVAEVDAPGWSATCSAPAWDGHVVVDVTGARVGDSHCGALAFFGNVSAPYDLSYHNGDAANGTYGLVVNQTESTVESGTTSFGADGGDQPFATEALYSARTVLTYESRQVYYRAQVRVAPGEPDA